MNNQELVTYLLCVWHGQNKSAKEIVQLLNQRGLLAPDLPEPSYIVTECEEKYPVWECSSRYSIENESPGYITIFDEGEPAESFTLQEARQLALALLAANTYKENQ